MVDLMDEVVKNIHRGIARAQRDYESWTDGDWLHKAPESMLTTYIAKEVSLAAKRRTFYIALERSVRGSVDDAGGVGRGRISDRLRLDGKFDLLISWANGYPRAIVEVKKQVATFTALKADLDRIVSVLRRESTTFRCGLLAFYTSWVDSNSEPARDRLLRKVAEIESAAKDDLHGHPMKLESYRGRVRVSGDSAWMSEVLKVSR